MTKSSVQSGHFPPVIVTIKASQVAKASSSDYLSIGNQALVSCLASFIHCGYITEVQRIIGEHRPVRGGPRLRPGRCPRYPCLHHLKCSRQPRPHHLEDTMPDARNKERLLVKHA